MSGRRIRLVLLALLAGGFALAHSPEARADEPLPIPAGFRVTDHAPLGAGVDRHRLVGPGPVVVNVARIAPGAPVSLRAVLSNDRVGDPAPMLERTSAMCRRVGCLAGVNADFFTPGGVPVGGMVTAGELVRSPVASHHQLDISADGTMSAGIVGWTGRIVASDLTELGLTAINATRPADGLVLYSPAFGPRTATNPHGVEARLRFVDPRQRLRAAQTAMVEVVDLRDGGNSPIPSDGLVLSGHGRAAEALRILSERIRTNVAGSRLLLRAELISTDAPSAAPRAVVESVGATPVLLRGGQRWVTDRGNDFVTGRHPRTAVAWRPGGATLLVTVDGRQPGYSEGISLPALADLLAAMGATDAVNLDGGGSTTFVERGVVANQPSDRLVANGRSSEIVHVARNNHTVLGSVERPVVSALMIVPSVRVSGANSDALSFDPRIPQALAVADYERADPASDPSGSVPALVGAVRPRPATGVVALALILQASVVVLLYRRRAAVGSWLEFVR